MTLSSGARQAVMMAAGWAAVACAGALGMVYFGQIRAVIGVAHLDQPGRAEIGSAQAEPSTSSMPRSRVVELKAGAFGHFHALADINGQPINVMVDSGASMVALTFEDARAAGFFVRDSDFTHRVNTANGSARVAPVTIDRVSIGDITVRNVPAAVLEAGKLETTLLGMSFLSRLQRVDMRNGSLVLQE
jgi:aspartyl protease family protein